MDVDARALAGRRVRLLAFSGEALVQMAKPDRPGDAWRCIEGIPEDADLLGVNVDPLTRSIWITVESASYEPVYEGMHLMQERAVFERINDEARIAGAVAEIMGA